MVRARVGAPPHAALPQLSAKNRSGRRPYPCVRCQQQESHSRASGEFGDQAQRPLVIKPTPIARTPAQPPQAAPIERSSAYLLQNRYHKKEGGTSTERDQSSTSEEPFAGNAVEWALRKADRSLEEVEENPPAYVKALYELSTGPVGTAASKGASAAAKLTVQAGTEALKAAAPVGKWLVTNGAKAVAGAVVQGITSAAKSRGKERGK